MKIEHETPFPTVGEVVQTAFRWSGLWNYLVFEDKDRIMEPSHLKTIQTGIQRFAAEKNLMSFDAVETMICRALSNIFGEELLCKFATRSAVLFLSGYIKEIRGNATWLDRDGSTRWFLYSRAVVPLVLTAQRMALLGSRNEVKEAICLPDEAWWFLPSHIEKEEWKTPIQKVITWWMRDNGFTTAEALEEKVGKKGHISAVTIKAWVNGSAVPEISTLQVISNSQLALGADEEVRKRSLIALVMLARLIKNFFDVAQRLLGETDTKDFLSDFRTLYLAYEKNERITFDRMLPAMLAKLGIAMQNASADDLLRCERLFRAEYLTPSSITLLKEVVNSQTSGFVIGDDFVSEQARVFWLRNNQKNNESVVFALCDMEKIVNTTRQGHRLLIPESTLERLMEASRSLGPDVNVKYMLLTVQARQAVCGGDLERAFELYVAAFQEARCRGGHLVEKICEELIALCCYRHSFACEHKTSCGNKNWVVARYLRNWCALMDICPDLIDADDTAYVKIGRQCFLILIGSA